MLTGKKYSAGILTPRPNRENGRVTKIQNQASFLTNLPVVWSPSDDTYFNSRAKLAFKAFIARLKPCGWPRKSREFLTTSLFPVRETRRKLRTRAQAHKTTKNILESRKKILPGKNYLLFPGYSQNPGYALLWTINLIHFLSASQSQKSVNDTVRKSSHITAHF